MTQGYVLTFRPTTGSGTIITDHGETVCFAGAESDSPLAGGDTVVFDVAPEKGATVNAETLQIIQHAGECHSKADMATIRQFFRTVRLTTASQTPIGV